MVTMLEPGVFSGTISAAVHAVARKVRDSVVLVYHRGGNGAGVIWRDDGRIVTNSHVVGTDGRTEIVLADGRKYVGIVAARHPTRDLAVGYRLPVSDHAAHVALGGKNLGHCSGERT